MYVNNNLPASQRSSLGATDKTESMIVIAAAVVAAVSAGCVVRGRSRKGLVVAGSSLWSRSIEGMPRIQTHSTDENRN